MYCLEPTQIYPIDTILCYAIIKKCKNNYLLILVAIYRSADCHREIYSAFASPESIQLICKFLKIT